MIMCFRAQNAQTPNRLSTKEILYRYVGGCQPLIHNMLSLTDFFPTSHTPPAIVEATRGALVRINKTDLESL